MMELTIEEIIDDLAYEGCRLFTWPNPIGWRANIDRLETKERWENECDHAAHADAIRDVYARFLPHAMGGRDS